MRLFSLALLMIISMGAEAQVKVEIGEFTGGKIIEKSQTKPDEKGLVTITITVTPDKGYTISQKDITVVATYPISGSRADTRAPEIAAPLTLLGKDPEDLSAERDYDFIISSTLGAWVKEANFSSDSKGPSRTIHEITSLSEITESADNYVITQNISGGTAGVSTFSGTLEADIDPTTNMPYRINGLNAPLFTTLTGTVKNLVLEDVSISGHSGNTGAIACTANGSARIYNVGILSGSVGGTGYTGGLVGSLDGTARVVNCYSYAEIKGGSTVGGIVGYNNVASTQSNIATMVMNCMFYGDITGGSTVSPVYGGKSINNLNSGGLATYNYYAYSQLKTKTIGNSNYNCAIAVEDRFLTRFELYRQLLNSNKKLAAIYASTTNTTVNPDDIAKWVLETADRTILDPKPYPVLKAQGRYPSIINIDAEHAPRSASLGRNKGIQMGRLTVKISSVGTNAPDGAKLIDENGQEKTELTLTITRTDKDEDRFNFNYDKIQLPYYNDVGIGNYTTQTVDGNKISRVVTGWKITSVTGGTEGTYDPNDRWGGYNFADRKCTNKDKYGTGGSNRVFSQGAYYDVPYDVTGITIEPYWGQAAYVSDQYYDVVYDKNYTAQNVTQLGTQCTNEEDRNINGSSQKVYTTIEAARSSMSIPTSGKTVYDYAVVLVGNVHQATALYGNSNTPYTIMSIDLDKDNEPDYSFIFSHKNRQLISPIRFDFLDVVGTAQAQKPKDQALMLNVSIFKPRGWFEVTNTCLMYFQQFEGDNGSKTKSPIILLGGVFDQFASTQSSSPTNTSYIHLGSNAWFKAFGNGTHSDGSKFTPHIPISVTGGDFEGFYLSGTYNPDANVSTSADNAECYISGGHFTEIAGAAQEKISGDVQWQIYNADITDFFGGGVNDVNSITGDITVDIFNSNVSQYCGGPKFGNMATGKKVTTRAVGCTFGKYFGAGYGGASYKRQKFYDNSTYNFADLNTRYNNERGNYYDGVTDELWSHQEDPTKRVKYGYKGPGVATDFDYEFFVWSSGTTGARFYIKYAVFSLAITQDVSSTLTKCIINGNFYGGGSLGKVEGTATSVLDDCTVHGNVFGGGYSATIPQVPIRNGGFTKVPNFNKYSGLFEPGTLSDTTPFDWVKGTLPSNGDNAINETDGHHDILTDQDLATLGQVNQTNLTIKGNTIVRGSVYGGGEESGISGDTEVNVTGGTIGYEGAEVYADLVGNVYGGGRGLADKITAGQVKGNTKITINGDAENPHIFHNVYGGGALGSVGDYDYNEDGSIQKYNSGGSCEVNILGGKIGRDGDVAGHNNGMVNGASRGDVSAPVNGVDKYDHLAWVHDTHVIIGDVTKGTKDNQGDGKFYDYPLIYGAVYGSGENGHTYQNTIVDVHSGTIGVEEIGLPDDQRYVARGNVYGSGCGTDTYGFDDDNDGEKDRIYYNLNAGIVWGNTEVNIYGGHIVRNVYGAGSNGSVGKFDLVDAAYNTAHPDAQLPIGKPYNCSSGGVCYVNVSGGMIGSPGGKMHYDDISTGPDDFGHVFGAGRGELKDSTVYLNMALTGYVKETHVTISNKAFITGSVYGGGECGHTLRDTYVIVEGGQIGVGEGEEGPYTDWSAASMKECSHWPYEKNNSPYDMYSGDTGYDIDAAKGGLKKATDGHTFYGNVFGGGSGYYPYAPGKWVRSAGLVEGNTSVTISGGHILSNVYGGNEHTDVYGTCTVEMTGGTVGVPRTWEEKLNHPVVGSLFGAGKGDKRVLFNTWTNVKSTSVTVSGGRVYGSVFGGGEDGHVLGDATTTIEEIDSENPTIIGTLGTTGYDGNVFGGGRGSYTALTAGVVCGNVKLDIKGGKMLGSVYGGGRLASVGTHLVPPNRVGDSQSEHSYYGKQIADGKKQVDWENYLDNEPANDADVEASGVTHGHITVNISGGTIGAVDNSGKVLNSSYSIGDVFGGCKGTTNGEYSNRTTGDNSEVAYNPVSDAQAKLGIAKSTIVNLLGGTVGNSIYGGGEVGNVGELGVVSVENSTLTYEDPTLAFAKINLLGGTVQNVYGGGLGMKENINGAKESAEALVKGDVKVNLNGLEPGDYDATIHGEVGTGEGKLVAAYNEDGNDGYDFYRANAGCIVTGTIFGCNNLNGTPTGHAKVHVFKTRAKAGQAEGDYDVAAVYGGGNRADYIPAASDVQQKTEVIIEGCDLTSIQQVYGGGNAAATPGTLVLVKGTKIIDEVFGGGNGVSSPGFDNPGANVGFYTGTTTPYGGDNGGKSLVQLMAGKVHNAYGGSNTKGDIRGGSNVVTVDNEYRENATGCCKILEVDYMFGGGKNAGMKSGANIILGCSNSDVWVKEIYAGAENADVEGDVSLTITSGKFGRVFGGNKESGKLEGSITVNIEENGQCGIPVIIGEIYGGGNKAPYSIYGFDSNGNILTNGTRKHDDPQVNIRAFTSIGNVYGGGYGSAAVMYGNPTVNINEVVINHTDHDATYNGNEYGGEAIYFVNDVLDPTVTSDPENMTNVQKVVVPAHTDGKMGTIQNVFGGGNAAAVHGNTNVNIGTTPTEFLVQLKDNGEPDYNTDGTPKKTSMDVVGADIRGNVYGGGNQAEVTGNTNVTIGKDATTSSGGTEP